MRHVHFIGIGGVGMSALAHILLARGVRVSGSDPHANAATARLATQGAMLYPVQSADNIEREQPEMVVATAAIRADNPELAAARHAGIPVVSRAQFLGRLMAEFHGPRIAVAGTHGKTTTTAMLAEILIAGNQDPTVLVGGEYSRIGGNVRIGHGTMFLTEACEAYDSFLEMRPDIVVITNIEADHLDHYGTLEKVMEGFQKFLCRIATEGLLVACSEDTGAREILQADPSSGGPLRTVAYGLAPYGSASVWASAIESGANGTTFEVYRQCRGHEPYLAGAVRLAVPGLHNVLNALAAAAVGFEVGISFCDIRQGLESFSGTERRFDVLGEASGIVVVDDYAHHPTEIRATLSAARAVYPDRRIVAVFQPHLYSRTRDFLEEFARSLADADAILLTDIYAAREEPIPGLRVSEMARHIAALVPAKTLLYAATKQDLVDALRWIALRGDVIITMGAGDIRDVGCAFLAGQVHRMGKTVDALAG